MKSEEMEQLEVAFEMFADAARIKEAKGLLNKLWRSRREFKIPRDFFEKYLGIVKDGKDIKQRVAILQGFNLLFWKVVNNYFDECVGLVLEMITHEDGYMREAARRLGENLRLHISFAHKAEEAEKKYISFLHSLAAIISKYRDGNTEKYVERLKPSVYKTATLLWHRVIVKSIDETWLSEAEIAELKVPVHMVDDDVWQEDNAIDVNEISHTLWQDKKSGYSEETESFFQELYKRAKNNLSDVLGKFTYTKEEIGVIERGFDLWGATYVERVLFSMTERLLDRTIISNLDEMGEIVCALQSYANHRFFYNKDKKPVSVFLTHAVAAREEYGRHIPINLSEFLRTVLSAHIEVDNLYDEIAKHIQSEFSEVLERWGKNDAKMNFEKEKKGWADREKEHLKVLENARSVVHHILDWYFQLAPWAVYNKKTKQLSAIGWFVVKEYNFKRGWHFLSYVEDSHLSAFGGWAANGIRGAATRAFHTITRGMTDEEMLKVLPTENYSETADWLLEMRRAVEPEAKALLKKLELNMSVMDWIDLIYFEEKSSKILEIFYSSEEYQLSQEDLNVISTMWNIYPHQSLEGLSPAEKMAEYQSRHGKSK